MAPLAGIQVFVYLFPCTSKKFSPLSFLDLLEEMRSGLRRINITAHAGWGRQRGKAVNTEWGKLGQSWNNRGAAFQVESQGQQQGGKEKLGLELDNRAGLHIICKHPGIYLHV